MNPRNDLDKVLFRGHCEAGEPNTRNFLAKKYPCPRKGTLSKSFRGFTLIEAVIGTALFLIVALAVYQVYVAIFNLIDTNQVQVLAIDLANEQFEIARNMPYASVGTVDGLPAGVIPEMQEFTRGGIPFTVTTIVRSIALSLGSVNASSTGSTSP